MSVQTSLPHRPFPFAPLLWAAWLAVHITGCQTPSLETPLRKTTPTGKGVEVIQVAEGQYQLFRHGKPFVIQGASGWGFWTELAGRGANTARTYSTWKLDSLLNLARDLNLTVAVGLDVPLMRNGANYADKAFAKAIQDSALAVVARFRHHPAVLCWVLGNEVNLMHHADKAYWQWTNETAKAIHEADPFHPVMVCVNEMRKNYEMAAKYAPAVDILGINAFQTVEDALGHLQAKDTWQGPVVLAEFSPVGYWEAEQTDWAAPIEDSDLRKAALIKWYCETYLRPTPPRLLGSLAFFWGQKQERTHTWFSMFSEDGEPTAVVDQLGQLWGDTLPHNHAPTIGALYFGEMEAFESMYLPAGDSAVVRSFPQDPDGDSLTFTWELLPEGDYMNVTGGDGEIRPEPLFVMENQGKTLRFQIPEKVGAYRLFAYVRDGKGGFGYHNIPFFVKR